MEESAEETDRRFVKNWLATSDVDLVTSTIKEWLDDHPEARDEIVRKHQLCPEIMMARLRDRRLSFSHPPPTIPEEAVVLKRKSSITEKPVIDLKRLDKNEMFIELLRNIVSPEFDVNSISYKILSSVLLLTNADRSSLFLVEGTGDNTVLVSRLFDVSESSTLESSLHSEADAIKIPITSKSIVGTVASTGKPLILNDAYSDPRFNTNVDKLTGYKTNSILCMPIKAANGQLLGVAQVINKKGDPAYFVEEDLEVFKLYLNFCGIALVNTQLFNSCFNLSRRLEVLLQTAGELFCDTSSLERMLGNIIEQAQKLVTCDRVDLFLVDEEPLTEKPPDEEPLTEKPPDEEPLTEKPLDEEPLTEKPPDEEPLTEKPPDEEPLTEKPLTDSEKFQFKTAFCYKNNCLCIVEATEISYQDYLLALRVARSGKVVATVGDKSEVTGTVPSSLTVPIHRKNKVIGVLKVTDKKNGLPFNSDDRDSLLVFAAFCGLGIHNVMNYETISRISAKQTVALEVLSYHASASEEDALKLMQADLPSSESLQLSNFRFDDQLFSEDETVLGAVRMFVDCDFVNKFRIDTRVLYRWILTVKKNYRAVIYHNWRHAFNVAQTMFTMFKAGKLQHRFTDIEQLAMIVGCLCHDLDHRGTNNAFQAKASSPLALLYSTSTMEHHHFDHCIMILNSAGNNIFNGLKADEYEKIIHLLESVILSTDLALFMSKRETFFEYIQNDALDWSSDSIRELTRGMFMTACDVAAISKPWKIQRRVAELVASEFFEQGDKERYKLNLEPSPMMDRSKKHKLPEMQVGFISFVCVPLYTNLAKLSENLQPLLDGTVSNRDRWQTMIIKPEEVTEAVTDETSEKPADTDSSVTAMPADTKAVTQSPVRTEPVTQSPVRTEPVTQSSVHTEPVTQSSVRAEPVTPSSVRAKSLSLSPVRTEPITLSPVCTAKVDQPVIQSSVRIEPVTQSSVRAKSLSLSPVRAKPVTPSSVRATLSSAKSKPLSARTTKTSPLSARPLKAGATKRGITPRGLSDAKPIEGWKSSDKKDNSKSQETSKTSQKRKCKSAI